ncbi:hypothetical protein C2S53_012096 [Perilla frutescens var. hirtella]|uniref:RING-type E3 ubiquitin transferase n=1 Tax=Perilla frutescens var. hirtella TaxID=608512 RepID=A0AAD4JJA9_PERFH|nr:hypothetical protein C2S53_012096 [Perilla frutescens var. hirtella]
MKGQMNWNGSFSETFDSHQESPSNSVDRMASLSNRLSPVDSRLSNHMLALRDGSISSTSSPRNRTQNNRGWEHGESSSRGNNVHEQMLDDDSKMKFAWYSPSGASSGTDIGSEDWSPEPSTSYDGNQVTGRSQNVQNYSSYNLPLNVRPNNRHLRENDCHSAVGVGRPHTLYESGRVGTEEILARYASSSNLGTSSCSSSTAIENNDASGPLFGTWGSSCKRKALEGGSRHFYPGASSGSNQPVENIVQHPVTGRCTGSRNLSISSSVSSADHLEQLNSRSGVGTSRVCSGRFTSSSVQGITENPVRNFALRSSPVHHESVTFDTSRDPSVGHSTLCASQPQSQPVSNSNALELMSPMTLPLNLNNNLNGPYVNVNEAGRTHLNPCNGSSSVRRGSSSSPFLLPGERGAGAQEEVNFRSSLRNIPEYLTTVHDTRNIFDEQIDWSFTPGASMSSRSYSGSLISPSSGGRSSSTARLPHQNQTSQDQRRLSEAFHWIPFPHIESDSGRSHRSPFPPLHLASSSSDERAILSHAQHQSDRRPSELLMDARGVNTNSRNVLAAVESRHRLIRQVLSAMRRGAHLRDEDHMLIDPFVNGFGELHDQHMDMRLDVDNMSYEELLALEEQIGNVSTGLSEEKIRLCMKKRKYKGVKGEPCCICQEDYGGGDVIGILDCGHEFHNTCIKHWLILKNICPICKNTALET